MDSLSPMVESQLLVLCNFGLQGCFFFVFFFGGGGEVALFCFSFVCFLCVFLFLFCFVFFVGFLTTLGIHVCTLNSFMST